MRAISVLALGVCLGLTLPAQAGVEYRAAATIEALVRGQTTQHVVLIDPPQGGIRVDSSYAKAGREVFLSGLGVFDAPIVAQGVSSAKASGNGLRAELWTSQQALSPFQYGISWGSASSFLFLTTTIAGAPGTSGTVRLDTRFGAGDSPAPRGDGARFSTAQLNASAHLTAQTPGAPPCRGDCKAYKEFAQTLRDGSSLLGPVDQPWVLEIQAKAGDTLTIQLQVGVRADNGYGAGIWFASPWSNVSPFAGEAAPGSYDAALQQAAGALASLRLGPGLRLAPTAGLMLLPDGSYGFTAPVPEPSTWLLMAGGLLGLFRLSRRAA
ncbi:MAG: PEP-CTERM sorting domain-containing protein [Burkholderiales bacterium]|nr:PEP-CTERM sorting domain-containing protein [Burkholderiales bacterium]